MNITVYCGAALGNNEIYKKLAKDIGTWIAENKYSLVYGGSSTGLMGIVADTALEKSARVIGVRPEFLSSIEPSHTSLTELIKVETMSERKKIMFENGDAYIALPGGLGTLEEISEVISWAMIGKNNKPCIIYNLDGFYDDLKRQFEKMQARGFLSPKYREKILFTKSIEEMDTFIKTKALPSR